MRARRDRLYTLLLFSLAAIVHGCTSTQIITANSTPAVQATVTDERRLDVGILPLEPGIPKDPKDIEKQLIVPDVRRAESTYIGYHLKDTLELTGNWAAVRVTPEPSNAVDLQLSGRILLSDGEQLKVNIRATDASGRVWFQRDYKDTASKFSYEMPTEDPFQDLYNGIANDLLVAQQQLSDKQILNIKQVANLKFAEDLAPDAFGDYLQTSRSGRVTVVQLPAEDDGMMARVARIKEQEYLFVDTLDNYYVKYYKDMRPSYDEWRHATYEEAVRLREVRKQARNRLVGGALLVAGGIAAGAKSKTWASSTAAAGVVVGGIAAIKSGLQRRKEAEIHAEALQELNQSLGSEITPYVLDIEGRTIELTGSARDQYVEWRRLLSDIYAQETDLPVQ